MTELPIIELPFNKSSVDVQVTWVISPSLFWCKLIDEKVGDFDNTCAAVQENLNR